jgi:lipoprotein-anchoring transpeptidase ErfK/SrfK
MSETRRNFVWMRRALVAVALAALLIAVGGCTAKPAGSGNTPFAARITGPADGTTGVAASAEITYAASAGEVTMRLVDATGQATAGALRSDGSSWVPATALAYATKYTATVTVAHDGRTASATSTFTTMAKPANLVDVHSWIGDDQVVGVAAPLVVTFGKDVPDSRRIAVERRLFVHSEPAQEGVWNWFSATEVHYRPKEHWRPGTKLDLRLGTGGLPWGGGWYGRQDLTVRASVGPDLEIVVDNATKQMTVTQDGTLLRTIPVSLGKPSTPSSSGNLVVMVKNEWEWFDSSTYGVPANSPDGFRTKVFWPMRLTWGGEYIHAAPWSAADQGHRNVSHGCVNISTEAAQWLWGLAHIGDPVTVRGTEHHLDWGNGWTDWDRPWEQYVRGSALPYPPASASPPGQPMSQLGPTA